MEEPHMDIGKRLTALRGARELSQGDVEKRTGLLRCYISRVENGHTIPSIETLERWASALEVEVYQLFFEGEGKPEPVPVGAMEALDKSEEKLLGFFRRANEADRQFMLQVGRKLAK
jgi:transcriptional regulator with XRE-family HTH domain